jgi:hypothetical protein
MERHGEERDVTQFWYTIFWPTIATLAVLAAIINFAIAVSRRQYPVVALVRGLAGTASLALALIIALGKAAQYHPEDIGVTLQWQTVFIATGVFIFAVLWLPSYVERGSRAPARPTIQERAARPAKATIRLQRTSVNGDEWVN